MAAKQRRTNQICECGDTAAQIYPSHRGDRITCSAAPAVTQLGGGCLKAVTLTHSSILPNHPPTEPHSRGAAERQRRQTEGEAVNMRGRPMSWRMRRRKRGRRMRRRMWKKQSDRDRERERKTCG